MTPTHSHLWTVDSTNVIKPFGHLRTKVASGDYVLDFERDEAFRLIEGRHDRLIFWPIGGVKEASAANLLNP